jgi:hypothetical protein
MNAHPHCICVAVSAKALASILDNGGRGAYRDNHPWLIAEELLQAARDTGSLLPLVLATGTPLTLAHWACIRNIDVAEMHHGAWESRCEFEELQPVSALFTSIDSIVLRPAAEDLRREQLEGIKPWRHPLDERHVRPYAICETPAFITVAVHERGAQPEG